MELSQEEMESMLTAFKKMGFQPKVESPKDLKTWIEGISQKEHPVKQEEEYGGQTSASHRDVTYQHFPKLPFFSGESGKDTDYDHWIYEVECLIATKTHSHDVILQAIRKSLKGEAAIISMKLGPHADFQELLSLLFSTGQMMYGLFT